MKEVYLGGRKAAGRVALVDDEDYDLVNARLWCLQEGTRQGPRAVTGITLADGRRSTLSMHKFLTGWSQTDHKDGNALNNQRSNLRPATTAQNNRNRGKRAAPTSSQFKGVTWNRQALKWQAQIGYNGRLRYLGRYSDETEAARAYDNAALELFGEFAFPNFSA